MAYNSVIPAATDQLNVSQGQIQANFGAIKTLIDVNHVTFDITDQGKHKWVTFPRQASAPVSGATEVNLFSMLSSLTNQSELIFQRQANGDQIETTSAELNDPGWSYLPSGLLIKWQSSVAATGGAQTILYPSSATIPDFTTVFAMFLTIEQGGGTDVGAAMYVSDVSNPLQFEISSWVRNDLNVPAACNFQYYAIGI